MSLIVVEVLIILALVLINGVFALAEIAIVASRRARLQRLADQGNRRAKAALQLAESPADFLSTVQVGITLVGVLSGAFAGATLAEQLALFLSEFSLVAAYAETISLAVVVVAITYLSLILGELVPKRIALNNPERIGALMARPMRFLSKLALPAVRLLSMSTDGVLALLRVKPSGEPSITEDEVRILIRQGTAAGVIEKSKQEMIDRVFRLGTLRLPAIMTPRSNVVALYTTDSAESIAEKLKAAGYSHYPLCDVNLDNVLGVVSTKDLLLEMVAHGRFDLRSSAREVLSIPESSSALDALELMRDSESEVALVIDEFGGLQGIVTMNDFAGAIVGVLPEAEMPRIIKRKDGSLLVDGRLPVADLQEAVHLPPLFAEEQQGYSTVGGFVLARIGRIPEAGDGFTIGEYRFEVLDMDGLRVDKLLITRTIPSAQG
jgi:putative hemolysin